MKIDDGTARVIYVQLLSHEPGSKDIPVVNMLKVSVCLTIYHLMDDVYSIEGRTVFLYQFLSFAVPVRCRVVRLSGISQSFRFASTSSSC